MKWMAAEPGKYERKTRDDLRNSDGDVIRIATNKETGKRNRLARIIFNENKAIIFGDIISFTLVKWKGKDVYDVIYKEPATIPIDTITWKNEVVSIELLEELKNA